MGHFVGIDLGTAFSAISILDETGRPKIIHNSDGQNITPSCVAEIDGKYEVGEEARRTWVNNPEGKDAAARFKRDMGTDKKYVINGRELTPTDLSALVLVKLKMEAINQIGEIAEAVVTIPANFSHEARQATMAAANSVGLNVRKIINEPTAAALYYAFKEGKNMRGIYAVYDLGGGTFDVSIIRADGYEVKVLATDGVRHLGGDDFDKALQNIVAKKYQEKTGEVLESRDYDDVEEDKKSLSKRQKIVVKASRQALPVTREEFEAKIIDLITKTETLCESVMKEARISPSDISDVLLAGGSTRIPLVKKAIERVFGKKPKATVNVDEVVSMGAVLYAAHGGDDKHLSTLQKNSLTEIKISEITSQYFGVLALRGGNRGYLVNSIMIEKGTKIPCEKSDSLYTTFENQMKVRCRITESGTNEADPKKVSTIWDGDLDGLPPNRPPNREIYVTYSYDENQIMHCSFVDIESGKTQEVDLSMIGSKGGLITVDASDLDDIE